MLLKTLLARPQLRQSATRVFTFSAAAAVSGCVHSAAPQSQSSSSSLAAHHIQRRGCHSKVTATGKEIKEEDGHVSGESAGGSGSTTTTTTAATTNSSSGATNHSSINTSDEAEDAFFACFASIDDTKTASSNSDSTKSGGGGSARAVGTNIENTAEEGASTAARDGNRSRARPSLPLVDFGIHAESQQQQFWQGKQSERTANTETTTAPTAAATGTSDNNNNTNNNNNVKTQPQSQTENHSTKHSKAPEGQQDEGEREEQDSNSGRLFDVHVVDRNGMPVLYSHTLPTRSGKLRTLEDLKTLAPSRLVVECVENIIKEQHLYQSRRRRRGRGGANAPDEESEENFSSSSFSSSRHTENDVTDGTDLPLTEIQQTVMPFIMQKRDVLFTSPAMTGKTFAYAFPLLLDLLLRKENLALGIRGRNGTGNNNNNNNSNMTAAQIREHVELIFQRKLRQREVCRYCELNVFEHRVCPVTGAPHHQPAGGASGSGDYDDDDDDENNAYGSKNGNNRGGGVVSRFAVPQPQVLVLAPTSLLVWQVFETFQFLVRHIHSHRNPQSPLSDNDDSEEDGVESGGLPKEAAFRRPALNVRHLSRAGSREEHERQLRQLRRCTRLGGMELDVLVTSPETILPLLLRGDLSLARTRAVVLDEVDDLLSLNHYEKVKMILGALPRGASGGGSHHHHHQRNGSGVQRILCGNNTLPVFVYKMIRDKMLRPDHRFILADYKKVPPPPPLAAAPLVVAPTPLVDLGGSRNKTAADTDGKNKSSKTNSVTSSPNNKNGKTRLVANESVYACPQHTIFMIGKNEKIRTLLSLFERGEIGPRDKVLIFCNSRRNVAYVSEQLSRFFAGSALLTGSGGRNDNGDAADSFSSPVGGGSGVALRHPEKGGDESDERGRRGESNVFLSTITSHNSGDAKRGALRLFYTGISPVLVATDIAARGVQFHLHPSFSRQNSGGAYFYVRGGGDSSPSSASVTVVVHYDVPNAMDTFTHRNGRLFDVRNVLWCGGSGGSGERRRRNNNNNEKEQNPDKSVATTATAARKNETVDSILETALQKTVGTSSSGGDASAYNALYNTDARARHTTSHRVYAFFTPEDTHIARPLVAFLRQHRQHVPHRLATYATLSAVERAAGGSGVAAPVSSKGSKMNPSLAARTNATHAHPLRRFPDFKHDHQNKHFRPF